MKLYKTVRKIFKISLISLLIILALAVSATFLFQDKIIQLTFSELNKHLSTKIEIDQDVKLSIFQKFPEISIQVKNVQVYESFPESQEKLASLNKLFFTFNAFDFLKGRYVINNIYAEGGDIKIAVDSLGHGNYFIFKTDTTSASSVSFDLKKITLNDVLLIYTNKAIHQSHQVYIEQTSSSLKLRDKTWFIGLDGDLLVHSIQIEGNEYLKEKKVKIQSAQEYEEEERVFKVSPSRLFIEGSEFSIAGFYKGDGKIDLDLKAEKSTIATLLSLLPKNVGEVVNRYKSSGNIFFKAKINGFITRTQTPEVKVQFGFSDASFSHPNYDKKVEKAALTGSFSNGDRHCLRSSNLNLSNVNGFFDGQHFKGNFSLENFEDPFIRFDCIGRADILSLLKFFPNQNIHSASGIVDMNVSFSGRVSDLKTKEGKERLNGNGSILLEKVNFVSNNIEYKDINGSFSFDKNDLILNRASGKIGSSDLALKGVFKNFVNKLLLDKYAMIVEAQLKSDNLDIDQILSAFSNNDSPAKKEEGRFPYLEDYKLKLKCDIGKMHYRKLNARSVKGEIEFDQPGAFFKNFSLNAAGGSFTINTLVNFKSKEVIEINAKSDLANIFIDSIFYISENFNQDFIQEKNIKGQFNGSVRLFLTVNNDMVIDPASVVATIDASILNGELNNFEPMKKLSRFVEVKELENIRFSELKNKIYIEGSKVVIPEMEIKTNVSNISIMGTHTFDQKMDYQLKVPLKNFKKKQSDKDEAFGAIEDDNKGNSLVFLTIKGTTDDYKVAYDTKRTSQKIKEDLKKEKKELENIFKKKQEEQTDQFASPDEVEFFDF